MKTTLIIGGIIVAIVIIWLALSAVWLSRQNLVGIWAASLPDGALVLLQFEGERKGGLYKQLVKRDGMEAREFGHWTINLTQLHLIMMATDVKEHPRFGIDTQYSALWQGKNQITIDGPDRPKLVFNRRMDGVKIDFDAPAPAN